MAVKIDHTSVMKKLPLSSTSNLALESGDLLVEVKPTSIKINHVKGQVWEEQVIPLSKGVLTLLSSNSLGKLSQGHIAHLIDTAITKLLSYNGGAASLKTGNLKVQGTLTGTSKTSTLETLQKQAIIDIPPPVKTHPAHQAAKESLANMKAVTGEPQEIPLKKVQLKDANIMYQPVEGTSSGSTYYYIAASDSLKVGIRLVGGKLSFRVEGDLHTNAANLEAAGMIMSNSHASVHLEVGTKQMARRTVGAILTDLGVVYITPIPEIDPLYNKGA
ncbi:MAG: hypothetical protein GQ570_03800 [Helicobacteraceae bacterium]|nr:hypothetical protein [Helicobacteraceae bacterium]